MIRLPDHIPRDVIVFGDTSDRDCEHLGEAAAELAGSDMVERLVICGLHSYAVDTDPETTFVRPEAARILTAAEKHGLNQKGTGKSAATHLSLTSKDLVENWAHARRDNVIQDGGEYGVVSHRNRRALWVGRLVLPHATLIDVRLEPRPQDEAQNLYEFMLLIFYRIAMIGVERGDYEEILARNTIIREVVRRPRTAPKLVAAIGKSLTTRRARPNVPQHISEN